MMNFSHKKQGLLKQVEQTVREFKLIQPGMSILCAVSGGPDSVCLFAVCLHFVKTYNLKLAIGHVHHGLREKDADEDASFVENLALKSKVPFYIVHADVIAYQKKNKLCLEEAAREVRYDALKKMCEQNGHQAIALGHHADDTAEQILMNLLRGTGTQGLTGIVPKRNFSFDLRKDLHAETLQIIRPLIQVSREDITHFLKDVNLSYVLDKSNQDSRFLRNRIRHQLLPLLQSYNPNIRASLNRLADIQRTDIHWLEKFSAPIFKRAILKMDDKQIVLNKEVLKDQHLAIIRNLFRNAILHVKGDLRRITHDHIQALSRWIFLTEKSRYMHLPDNIYVKFDYEKIHIFFKNSSKVIPEIEPQFSYCIEKTGRLIISERNMILQLDLISRDLVNINEDDSKNDPLISQNNAYFDADIVKFPMFIRNVEPGDRFQPLGMNGHQKLKKLFNNQKVPISERSRAAVLISQNKIVWVIGYRISQFAAITSKTRQVLACKYIKITDA
ncbi:tRNA(Ile)-lysidine synthetase [Candidatus Magnetomorum sp. HK-1]|nr:tRNA(Ile)-lysidine synthetase [Candidatus Magnetomorum sp. HK-1]